MTMAHRDYLSHNMMQSAFLPEHVIDLRKIFNQLYQRKWLILAAAFVTGFVSFLYALTIPPQFQSSSLLMVNTQRQDSNLMSALGGNMAVSSNLSVQEALMKTRYILEPVIEQAHLNISVAPQYYPFFGAWKARHYQGHRLAKPFFNLKSYAWGGEKIDIKQFSVPADYIGQTLKLVTGTLGAYRLYSDQDKLLLIGKVGQVAKAINGTAIKLDISTLNAHPGTEFFLSYKSPLSMVDSLAKHIQIIDVYGNNPSQNTGIIQITLTDADPAQAVRLLNAITTTTITKDIQKNKSRAKSSMKFLDDRLQETKNTLNQSENAFNQYLVQHSVVGMQLVGQLSERKLNTLEMQIEQLRSQQEELLQIYTPKHPLVIASYNKEKELKKRLEGVKAELLTYPQKNQEESHLKSSILLNNRIYTVLLNHKMQMEFSKAGLTSDLVLLSDATPPTTAATHRLLMTLVSCLIGAFLSSLLLLLRHLLNQTIEDATQLEEAVPLSVQCVVPFSQKQKHMDKLHQKTLKAVGSGLATTPLILAKQDPHDIAIESLRSLKMSLHINASNPNANLGIIALMGCVSGVGKSFTSLNLAQVFADSGKRTLLIDADIRKGRLHRACHLPQSKGLSELLENKLDYSTLTHTIHHNLTLLTCGTHTEHPLKLFQNTFFANVLSQMKADFDQVIIDTPPILPVSDAVLIALQCDIKLFVVSAGIDTIANVKQAIKKTAMHGININGIVLNHKHAPASAYGYGHYYGYGNITKHEQTPA